MNHGKSMQGTEMIWTLAVHDNFNIDIDISIIGPWNAWIVCPNGKDDF